MTLIDLILDQYEKGSKWNGEFTGNASLRIKEDKHYKVIGKRELLEQAKALEEEKLIKIIWVKGYYNYDIEKVKFSLSDLPILYEKGNRLPKYKSVQQRNEEIKIYFEKIKTPWIIDYILSEMINPLKNGEMDRDEDKTELMCKCLLGLDELSSPMFKKIFSKKYLSNSKIFEKELEKKVIRAAKKYYNSVEEDMDKTSVLSQIYIEEYSQELYVKGSLKIAINNKFFDTGTNPYGMVLNSQTIKNSSILKEQTIKRILTIENKANFMSEPYEEGTLIIYTHGYFTPLERNFLKQLEVVMRDKEIIYHHSGDLDYGGIRIFQYIRTKIFPDLKPYLMDGETFNKYISYAEEVEEEKLAKIEQCEEPLLQEVIDCIRKHKLVLEQEAYLY